MQNALFTTQNASFNMPATLVLTHYIPILTQKILILTQTKTILTQTKAKTRGNGLFLCKN